MSNIICKIRPVLILVILFTLFTFNKAYTANDGLPPTLVSFSSSTSDGTYGAGSTINITANFDEPISNSSTMEISLSNSSLMMLDQVSASTLSGSYVVPSGDTTSGDPLSVDSIASSDITSLDDTPPVNKQNYTTGGVTRLESNHEIIIDAISPTITKTEASLYDISITYGRALDVSSPPSTSDFTVYINGTPTSLSNLTILGNNLNFRLNSKISASDVVTIDYVVPVSNYLKDSLGNPISALSGQNIQNIMSLITVGDFPDFSAVIGTKLYVANKTSNDLSVINTLTNQLIATIPIGNYPYRPTIVGEKLYIINQNSNSVSVINTKTDTVISTIPVGSTPYVSSYVGDKLYVTNQNTDDVSVINTKTDTVIATVSVGDNPNYLITAGTKVYVGNQDDNNVSVIDSFTDTVIATIPVGALPFFSAVVGTKVYVGTNNGVSVINATTNTLSSNISIVGGTTYITAFGKKIYATGPGAIYVIDTLTDTVENTLSLSGTLGEILGFGDKYYFVNYGNNSISVVDKNTNLVTKTALTGSSPRGLIIGSGNIYTTNNNSRNLSVFNLKDNNLLNVLSPHLVSFSTSSGSGVYTRGQVIPITANFNKNLDTNSTMTVYLNSGSSVVLNQVSGSTLTGSYTIQPVDATPDLSVKSISSASISDTLGNNRSSYEIPYLEGVLSAENSLIARNIGDTKDIVIGSFQTISTGANPYQISTPINGNIYVANQGSASVSVIRQSDNSLIATIPVGSEPYGLTNINISGITYIYVANTGSDTVSVIDTTNNSVFATVNVGSKPYYVEKIGTKVYVTNGASNTVSVIDTSNNTVVATIPIGSYPRGIKAYGTDLYVANYGDINYSGGNYISVINSLNNTVSANIVLPAESSGPRGVTVLGSKVYVSNYRSNNISVIDTVSKNVTDTISVGKGPRGITGLGNNIYVENFDDGTISVISTLANTVTNTIEVGHSPSGMSISGTDIYISRFQDNKISVLDTTNNTLRNTTSSIISSSGGNSSGGGSSIFIEDRSCYNSYIVCSDLEKYKKELLDINIPVNGIKRSSQINTIKSLQRFLNFFSYYKVNPLVVDGKWGIKTTEAVKIYQKKNNLKSDGIFGPISSKKAIELLKSK